MANRPETSAGSNDFSRRDFIKGSVAAGVVAGGGLGAFYFGYGAATGNPVRVGVLGTGDEGSVLIGAINPDYMEVKSIADIRPYNVWRAFHGDHSSPAALEARPGLLSKYGWKSEHEARKQVKVYDASSGGYEGLLKNAKADGIEAVIIALPLHLHAPAAIAAMNAGLHVLTEKLMGHTVHACKEMARVAKDRGVYLAVGHQRHYNILYANAVDQIKRSSLGDLHYVRAQWHRNNLPGGDSWAQPMPKNFDLGYEHPRQKEKLEKVLKSYVNERNKAGVADWDMWNIRTQQAEAQLADAILNEKGKDGKSIAEQFGYEKKVVKDDAGKVVYEATPGEELIRWRLWDRTSAGLMAELGSHQLDAASIFIAAAHGGEKQMPLNVVAAANRPLFPPDRDVEDHVYCIIEFPAPGYDSRDPDSEQKRIGVQYASVNGNGFGGYGEIVFGTQGTLILESEQVMSVVKKEDSAPTSARVGGGGGGPTLDTQASGPQGKAVKAGGEEKVSRGYTEELEHWAWCIRNPAPENQPRCNPKVALGDAVIALTTNMAAREGKRIEFKKEWFEIDSDETPEGVSPDVNRYQA